MPVGQSVCRPRRLTFRPVSSLLAFAGRNRGQTTRTDNRLRESRGSWIRHAAVLSLVFALGASSSAQLDQTGSLGTSQIEELLSRAGLDVNAQATTPGSQRSLEVRVRWNAYLTDELHIRPDVAPPARGAGFTVSRIRVVPEPVVRPRAPELSTNALLVAAVNAQQQLRAWALLGDPRVLRHEEPARAQELRGQVLHATRPEFLISLPEDPTITELRFYTPLWSGQEFALSFIDSVIFRFPGR